eukprot:9345640-Karenia_brevis.AAC.1
MYHNRKIDGSWRHREDTVPEWSSAIKVRHGDNCTITRPFQHESAEDFPGAVGLFLADLRNGVFRKKLHAARTSAVSGYYAQQGAAPEQ